MRKESLINISKERKAAMIADIKAYFLNEREEEIGDLAAGMVLDFIVEKLAPEFYNQGVDSVPVHERVRTGYARDTGVRDGEINKKLSFGYFFPYGSLSLKTFQQ